MQPLGWHLAQPGALALGADEVRRRRARPRADRCWASPRPPCSPPSAAARLAVSIVSASSRPGSRRWAWRSTNPGATTQPRGVEHGVAVGRSPTPTATCDHPSRVDQHVGRPLARLVDDPPAADHQARQQLGLAPGAGEQVEQHRHAHGHPVGDLLGDHGAGQLGRVDEDLDAAVHRPGVHHEGVLAEAFGPLAASARSASLYSRSEGHDRLVRALALHPQQVQHVDLADHGVEVVGRRHVGHRWQQRDRGDERDVGAEQP